MMKPIIKSSLIFLGLVIPASAQQSHIDPALKDYVAVSGVSGRLSSVGSDTLNNLMTLWAEGFKKQYPNVTTSIEGKGSSTAPPALMEGTAALGPMSRPMKSEEIDAFEKKFGYKPTAVRVAIDALAVFAHKDAPIKGLTLKQVDGVFSNTRKRGSEDLTDWSQLGVKAWSGRTISLYGRNSASGTHGFFQEHVLEKGDYKPSVKEQPGSSAVVQGIAGDLYGIGYSGIGYKTSGVKAVPIGTADGKFYDADYDNALSGDYPIARFLMVYVNKKPGKAVETTTLEFLKFALSKRGQEIVEKDGYFPLPDSVVMETLNGLSK